MADLRHPPQSALNLEYYAGYSSWAIWQVLRAMDWPQEHHEQTYDIRSNSSLPKPLVLATTWTNCTSASTI